MRCYRSRQWLDVRVEEEGGISVVTLEGAIESATVMRFQSVLDDLCTGPAAKILLDCAGLTYVNSAALGLLVKYHGLCEESGGHLAICRLPSKTHQLVKLMGLDAMLHIYHHRSDGRTAVGKVQ